MLGRITDYSSIYTQIIDFETFYLIYTVQISDTVAKFKEYKKSFKKVEKSFADKIKVISFASAFETSKKKDTESKKKVLKKLKKVLQRQ